MPTRATVAERDMRYARLRKAMAKDNVDVLLIAGKGHGGTELSCPRAAARDDVSARGLPITGPIGMGARVRQQALQQSAARSAGRLPVPSRKESRVIGPGWPNRTDRAGK